MRIQHNIMAMNAYRNYNTNTSALSKNLEKLSSGYKINRAGDDAAGLAISEKMRAQITGLNAAQKNVKDGISLVKTAEGAMQEIQDMLNRMDYLATQSANGTYDNEVDRLNLQKEVTALKSEINRIADSANFNGIKLLDGKTAMATSISALGELDKEGMIDGTDPTKGGYAKVVVNMSGAAGNSPTSKPVTASTDTAKTFDGQAPNAASKAEFTFTVAAGAVTKLGGAAGTAITAGTTSADNLKAVQVGGKTVQELFDLKVDGSSVAWTNTTGIAAGAKITLTAKNPGATGLTAADVVDGADGSVLVNPGADEGAGAAASNASYAFTLDLGKLEGGQSITLNGKTISIENTKTATGGAKVNIYGLDLTDKAASGALDTLATTIKTALADTTDGVGTDFDVAVKYNSTTGEALFTLTAKAAGAAGNKGELTVSTATANNPLSGNITHTAGQDAGTGTAGKLAQATFESDDLKLDNLKKAGTEFKLGSTTYKVVASGAKASNNELNVADVNAAKITELLQKNLTEVDHKSTVAYDGDTGTVTFTSTEYASGKVDALKGKTIEVKNAPVSGEIAKGTATSGSWAGKEITTGTTKLDDVKNHTITVGGKSVKLSDLFNITAENAAADGTIGATTSITFEAKQKGKLTDEVMNAITYDTKAASEVTQGWDEGQLGAGSNTHYELLIDPTNSKLAGGASFSFGTGDDAATFDITYDNVDTGNGTVGSDKDEVGGSRVKINLSASMTADEKAAAIKTAVESAMDDFNVKATIVDGKIKLEATAKEATADTNYGGVRFSSAEGAFSGGVYNAYNAFDGGTEGTYAQVRYDFDLSKLKAGDKITIGGTTINVGDADATERNADGKITSVTIAESKAQTADELISAFESAGFQSGRLSIENGKLTITDAQKTGRTADDLARAMNVSVSSSTRALTEGGLTLQIGDTSDSFNRLTVSIGDMHTEALGIDGIDISNPTGAAAAIQTIKDAINQVSSVRGDLGATQNRLEHTANNLSVMAENIQDAESTIRDTDIAEEMMAYTKNNILVQSAQAMLAQANAVPQGVLQLLG